MTNEMKLRKGSFALNGPASALFEVGDKTSRVKSNSIAIKGSFAVDINCIGSIPWLWRNLLIVKVVGVSQGKWWNSSSQESFRTRLGNPTTDE